MKEERIKGVNIISPEKGKEKKKHHVELSNNRKDEMNTIPNKSSGLEKKQTKVMYILLNDII